MVASQSSPNPPDPMPAGAVPVALSGQTFEPPHWPVPEHLARLVGADSGSEEGAEELDRVLLAAARGEVDLWVPCGDLEQTVGPFALPVRDRFARLPVESAAALLRDRRVDLSRLRGETDLIVLTEPLRLTPAGLFVAPEVLSPTEGAAPAPEALEESEPETSECSEPEEATPTAPLRSPAPREQAHTPTDELREIGDSGGVGPNGTTSAPLGDHTDRILRVADVCRRVGLARTTLWRREREGKFPARRRLGPQGVGWLESEVIVWIQSREVAGPAVAQQGEATSST